MNTNLYTYKTEPYKHQVDAVTFVADHCLKFPDDAYFALFMSQGTGKTKTLIDIAENLYQAGIIDRVLIIAPNGVHEQWGTNDPKHGQIVTHGFVPSSRFVWHSSKKNADKARLWMMQTKGCLLYFCVNVEAFSVTSYLDLFKNFVAGGKTFVVIDEATSIKNPQANRTSNIINGLSECQFRGRRLMSRLPCSKVRAILTGTPFAQGAYGVWSMFDFLKQNYFGMNYYAFKARYGIERTVQYPGMIQQIRKPLNIAEIMSVRKKHDEENMTAEEIAIDMGMAIPDVQYILDNREVNTPYKNMKELKEKIALRSVIIRKEDCLDLPEKIYERVFVPMNEEQKRVTKELQKSAWALYQQGALDVKNKASLRIRLHQIAGGFFPNKYEVIDGLDYERAEIQSTPIGTLAKVEAIKRRIEGENEFPLIIVTAFRAEAQALFDELSKTYPCTLIIGGMNPTERKKSENSFLNGESKILIATETTIAKGFNFQIASTMYFYSSTYSAEDRDQIEDRIHRIGQTNTCVYVDFLSENSVDLSVLEVVTGNIEYQKFMTSDRAEDFFKFIRRDE